MWELFGSGLLSVWLNAVGVETTVTDSWDRFSGAATPGLALVGTKEPATDAIVQSYLQQLSAKGLLREEQGIWIQTGYQLLTSNQGTTPMPAASLTKVATSLAAISRWELNHQFETLVGSTGTVVNGVLQGDLVVTGGGDPLFVWEEAISLGLTLEQLGIRRISGNLVIAGNFTMNEQPDPRASGELLRLAWNQAQWTPDVAKAHSQMGGGKPNLEITGQVVVRPAPTKQKLLVRHLSLPLAVILKRMNVYSNNFIAETLADGLGGAQVVRSSAAKAALVPVEEILLMNGSGLGVDNRISPRAVCSIFMAIQRDLLDKRDSGGGVYTLGDLFPISGRDRGTIEERRVPKGATVKTGSLWNVSGLAGALPTEKGLIWFAIVNGGDYLEGFRAAQDDLLHQLVKEWGTRAELPSILTPQTKPQPQFRLGAPERNQIIAPESLI